MALSVQGSIAVYLILATVSLRRSGHHRKIDRHSRRTVLIRNIRMDYWKGLQGKKRVCSISRS